MQKTPLPYQENICQLFKPFTSEPFAVLLDSGNPSPEQGRFDIFSCKPSKQLRIANGKAWLIDQFGEHAIDFEHAKSLLEQQGLQQGTNSTPFCQGWIGFSSYELGYQLNPEAGKRSPSMLPDFWAGYYDWAVVQDHKLKTATLFCAREFCQKQQQNILQKLQTASKQPSSSFVLQQAFHSHVSFAEYQQQFHRIQDYLHQGDCYQVNFAQRFSAPYQGDSFNAYQKLRAKVPSPYMAYINFGDKKILSISPECFIQAKGNHLTSKPIKGTSPRGNSPENDIKLAQQLQRSEKNLAENLMIVDLIRNDLSHYAKPNSVQVPELFALQSYSNVHHLVSTVTATLKPEHSVWQAFFASFPGGSITGAPKIRACQIIHELEPFSREIYCGSIFYASTSGQFDSNIAIRTLLLNETEQTAYAWAGGGIVVDSTCEDEYQECFNKIASLLKALE